MSHNCEFCEASFTQRSSLTRHQKTAKTCLKLQRDQGLNTPEPIHTCACGETFHRKYHLTRHQASCATMISNSTVITNNQISINNNNQFNIQIFGSTASSLTPEIIKEKVIEALTCADVEAGLARMTETVARDCFSNEKGNWFVRSTDASRNKLVVRTDKGDIADIQGYRTTRMLKKPFMEASLMALEETDKPTDVENTIEEIQDNDIYNKKTMGVLLRVIPTTFESEQAFPVTDTEAYQIAEEKVAAKLDRVMVKRKRKKAKQLELEAAKWKDEFLDRSQDLHDGTFWHPTNHFVIQPDEKLDFTILGRREKRGDVTVQLTKADLKTISEMGLEAHLDEQYKSPITSATTN